MSQVVFVSHGGGPLPLLGDPGHQALVQSFGQLRLALPRRPSLVLVISAHWEASSFSFLSTLTPSLLYDYSGFAPEAYNLSYPAPGAPEWAERWAECLLARGWQVKCDDQRGWDHGVFVPLSLLYPDADVPVLQLSLQRGLDPAQHWQLAEALAPMLPDDALVLGSGFSFHNMPGFFAPKTAQFDAQVQAFGTWLDATVMEAELATRKSRWLHWAEAPDARFNHPREEHLLPLLMCAAVAGRAGTPVRTEVMDVLARHYVWQ